MPNRLKELRRSLGITQKELASSLGIAQPTLSGWETERCQIDYDNLVKLADFFGTSIDYILGRNVDEQTTVHNSSPTVMRLKEVRKTAGLTQREVAQALNVTTATYSRYENGLIQPGPETLKNIALLLNTSVDFLLGSISEDNLLVDYNKPIKPAVRSDEEKLLGVYNSLDEQSKTQLMSVAYLLMSQSLKAQGIDVQEMVEQQLHKIKDEGWERD